MKSFFKKLVLGLAVAATLFTGQVSATPVGGVRGIPMPSESKLMVFPYDPNASYTILSRPNAVTDMVLAPDEKLSAMAAGDSTQWIFSKAAGHIFIKPIRSDLFTSATIVTSKRTYQLTLRSVSERAHWYQRVSWNYPDLMLLQDPGFAGGMGQVGASDDRAFPPEINSGLSSSPYRPVLNNRAVSSYQAVTPDKYNHGYVVKGKAEFAPTDVFDDGRFIWMRIVNSQELPAVFMINRDGDPEIVNWVRKGDYIVVQRLAPGVLLKIGRDEVRVEKVS